MFANLRDVPTFGNPNASAWAYTEKDPFNCSRTSNPPAPDEADVRALLRMLSCRVDNDQPNPGCNVVSEAAAMAAAAPLKGRDESLTGAGAATSQDSSEDFLHLFQHPDVDDAAAATAQLLKPGNAMRESGYGRGCGSHTTFLHLGSSSSNTLTGSSSASSHTDQPASMAASRCAESSVTRLSTSHTSRHNTAVSNALANIGSGLAEENFNVLTPDKRMMLSIPADYIQTTLGSRNYRRRNRDKLLFSFCLCKTYCSGATCHHGADCDFIHCDPEKLRAVQNAAASKGKRADTASVHSFQVHWSTPVASLADAVYPCLPSGYVVYVKGGEGASGNTPQALPSEMVYTTVGGQEALRLPSTAPLRVCKHFEREKCARGALCHFIHPVVLAKSAAPPAAAPTAGVGAVSRPPIRGGAPAMMPSQLLHQQQRHQQHQQQHQRVQETAAASHLRSTPPTAAMPHAFVDPAAAAMPHPSSQSAALLLTAAQLPSGALVRYGEALFMWVPERQQLVPLHTTTAAGAPPPTPGHPSAMMVNVDYQRGSSGNMAPPAGFSIPANAMLVQSSSAVAAYPPQNPYTSSPMQQGRASVSASQNGSPVYPSMLFPC